MKDFQKSSTAWSPEKKKEFGNFLTTKVVRPMLVLGIFVLFLGILGDNSGTWSITIPWFLFTFLLLFIGQRLQRN